MKKIIIASSLLSFFLCVSVANIKAQSMTTEDVRSLLIKEWERAKAYTNEYLNAMPADKYAFKATDSIRSFAQQMLHIAGGNIFLMMNATDHKVPAVFGNPQLENSPGAQKKDSVVFYVNASYDYCIDAVKNLDLNKWAEKKKIFGLETTRFALALKTFEHQTHHRGQTTIYIREVGIRPPQEKLF
jgi:uncharacterized damage-inducible protein DinB